MDHSKSDGGGGVGAKVKKEKMPQEIINKIYIFPRILAKRPMPKEDLCR